MRIPLRLVIYCCFSVPFLVAACGRGTDRLDEASSTVPTVPTVRLGELLPSVQSEPLSVTLEIQGDDHQSFYEVLVLRQGGGTRRWDLLGRAKSASKSGTFVIDTTPLTTPPKSLTSIVGCSWLAKSSGVDLSCGEGADPGQFFIAELPGARVVGGPHQRRVGEVDAACWDFNEVAANVIGEICLRASDSAPILMSFEDPSLAPKRQTYVAVDIQKDVGPPDFAVDLLPPAGAPTRSPGLFQGVVDAARLGLP